MSDVIVIVTSASMNVFRNCEVWLSLKVREGACLHACMRACVRVSIDSLVLICKSQQFRVAVGQAVHAPILNFLSVLSEY